MQDPRTIHVQEILERVSRADYIVDERKVAEAIVARLLAGKAKPTA